MAALRRFWVVSIFLCLFAEGCVPVIRVIRASYPPGAVAVRRAADDGHVWVTEPGWFTILFPSTPKVGRRVFASSYGPVRMKTLSGSQQGSYIWLAYCELEGRASDVEDMQGEMRDGFAHTPGERVVADKGVARGSWNGIALRLLLAPHSKANPGRFALDMHAAVFTDSHRLLVMFAGGKQGDTKAAATALAITDSLRFAR